MKINEIVLLEHVVNLHTPEEKQKYVDIVWDMLQKAYAPIGGCLTATSKEDLIRGSSIWKLVRKAGKIVSVGIYKDQFGRKSVAIATDATEEGKKQLIKTKLDDIKLKRAWAEVSGKVEHIMNKLGEKPLSSKYAALLTKKEIIGYDVDGVHYTRLIAGEPHVKVIYGFPELTPDEEAELKKNNIKINSI